MAAISYIVKSLTLSQHDLYELVPPDVILNCLPQFLRPQLMQLLVTSYVIWTECKRGVLSGVCHKAGLQKGSAAQLLANSQSKKSQGRCLASAPISDALDGAAASTIHKALCHCSSLFGCSQGVGQSRCLAARNATLYTTFFFAWEAI